MNAWIVYEPDGAERNREYIDMYKSEGLCRNISFSLVMCDDIRSRKDNPDFAVVRAMRPDITALLESRGVPVFNNLKVSEICNDKSKTYAYLSTNNIPVIPWISAEAGESAPPAPFIPCVLKPCGGHGGSGVVLAKNEAEYISLAGSMRSGYVIQRLAEDSSDTRVYVIGKKIVAAVMRRGRGDFRSNFSLGGDVCKRELTDEEKKLIYSVCELFEFGLVGIDIMYYNGHPVINEIEDTVGSRMLYATHKNIDIVSEYLDYIEKSL